MYVWMHAYMYVLGMYLWMDACMHAYMHVFMFVCIYVDQPSIPCSNWDSICFPHCIDDVLLDI